MKPSELPPDDKLRAMIEAAFGKALGAASGPEIILEAKPMGRPFAPALTEAYEAVDDLIANSTGINEARRVVYAQHGIRSSFETFQRNHQRHADQRLRYHFNSSILFGDIDEAIAALKACSDRARDEIWAKLNPT